MELMERRRILLNTPHINIVTGLQFVTDMVAPIDSLVISFSPIQDLHGYDNPWPAGGGANKWDEQLEYGRIDLTSGAPTADQNYKRSANFCACLPQTSYYGKAPQNPSTFVLAFYDANKSYLGYLPTVAARNTVFTTPENAYFFKLYVSESSTSEIAINYPSTVTTYSPYSNICPISGHTDADVIVSPTLNPLDGTTYPIPLGQTVYGGTLDVTSGVLTVDRAMVDLGSLYWRYTENYGFISNLPGAKKFSTGLSTIICSKYAPTRYNINPPDFTIALGGWSLGTTLIVADSTFGTDATAFKNGSVGVQLCYELATPQTYQLTPQQVLALKGTNNLLSNSNGGMTVNYWTHLD